MEKTKETTVSTATKNALKREPRNFLATLLFAVGFGQMGANRFYSGDLTLGWVRFGLFAGGILLSPLFIGLPLILAAHVWGWVDVFLVYHGKRTDVDGAAMTQTERDRKAAKIIYILFVVSLALAALSLVIIFILAVVMGASFGNYNNGESFRDYDSYPQFERNY